MTAREALAFTLTFLLIALVALVLTYRADLSREVQKQAALVDSIEVLNNRAEIIRNDPLVVACSYASRADLYDGDGNRLLIVNYGVVSGRLSPMADSIETLNAKLADAEAQATERLKGWRSVLRSTPMPDSSWSTIPIHEAVRMTPGVMTDSLGRVIVSPLSDIRRRSAESALRTDSLLREPEGVR